MPKVKIGVGFLRMARHFLDLCKICEANPKNRTVQSSIKIDPTTRLRSKDSNMRYSRFLAIMHRELDPAVYLEIGVRAGRSLAHARGRALAIDPDLSRLRPEVRDRPEFVFFEQESDCFFRDHRREDVLGDARVDFAFIDGLHHSDQVARDFANVERWSHPGAVVALHDCWPDRPEIAYRESCPGQWAGDCWRVIPFLRRHRPDLELTILDSGPTGLLLVRGLNPDAPDVGQFSRELDTEVTVSREQQDREWAAYRAREIAVEPEIFLASIGWTPREEDQDG
jgi:hypothetical protein